MSQQERKQRITLRVEDVPLKLIVPASQESYYRRAASDLATTVSLYRARYPMQAGMSPMSHILMAAIDVGYRSQLWRESAETRSLLGELSELNEQAERMWVEHRHLLSELENSLEVQSSED